MLIVRKDHNTAQAGFTHTKDGASSQYYSLGAVVAKTLATEGVLYEGKMQAVHNWLGAFKLPDDVWVYFAVRDANFLPNGDFAGTKEEVLDRLHGDYGLGGWSIVVGEAELENYGYHNFNCKRIDELIPRKKSGKISTQSWWKLRSVKSRFSPLTVALMSVGFAVILAVSYFYWQQYQKKNEEQRRKQAIEVARQEILKNRHSRKLSDPWINDPRPDAFITACTKKLSFINVGGWKLDNFSCTSGKVSYIWSRQESAVNFLMERLPEAKIDLTGNSANMEEAMPLNTGSDESLLPYRILMEPLIARLQLMGVTAKITKIILPVKLGNKQTNGMNQEVEIKPQWESFSYEIQAGALPPTELIAMLNQPGIRINKIVYQDGDWTIKGTMYAKLS